MAEDTGREGRMEIREGARQSRDDSKKNQRVSEMAGIGGNRRGEWGRRGERRGRVGVLWAEGRGGMRRFETRVRGGIQEQFSVSHRLSDCEITPIKNSARRRESLIHHEVFGFHHHASISIAPCLCEPEQLDSKRSQKNNCDMHGSRNIANGTVPEQYEELWRELRCCQPKFCR